MYAAHEMREEFRRRRKALRLTQGQAGALVGLTQWVVSDFECGANTRDDNADKLMDLVREWRQQYGPLDKASESPPVQRYASGQPYDHTDPEQLIQNALVNLLAYWETKRIPYLSRLDKLQFEFQWLLDNVIPAVRAAAKDPTKHETR